MNPVDFTERFSTEAAREDYLCQLRWKEGFRFTLEPQRIGNSSSDQRFL